MIFAALAIPLAAASIALACGVYTPLRVDPPRGAPGTTLSGVGKNYSTAPGTSPVQIRIDSIRGPVLWSGRPDAERTIRPEFEIPRVSPGYHVLLATQTLPDGNRVAGTPGRDVVKVLGSSRNEAVPAAPGAKSDPSGGGGLQAPSPALMGSALLALGLAGGGVFLLRRRESGAELS
jgi:hypothetical protein